MSNAVPQSNSADGDAQTSPVRLSWEEIASLHRELSLGKLNPDYQLSDRLEAFWSNIRGTLFTESGTQDVYTVTVYTMWLICDGIKNMREYIARPGHLPTVSNIVSCIKFLQQNYLSKSKIGDMKRTLLKLETLIAMIHRFVMVPTALIDSKYCTECLFEINHAVDKLADELESINCSHLLVRHDAFVDDDIEAVKKLCAFRGINADFFKDIFNVTKETSDGITCEDTAVENSTMYEFLNGNMSKTDFELGLETGAGVMFDRDALGFSDGIEYIRCMTQIEKWKKTVELTERSIDDVHKRIVDHLSPRYPGRFMVTSIAEISAGLNKRMARMSAFEHSPTHLSPDANVKALLVTAVPTQHQAVMNIVSLMVIDPSKTSSERYTVITPRIRMHKFMLSLGYSSKFSTAVLGFLREFKLPDVLHEPRYKFISRAWKRPDSFMTSVLKITWAVVHLLAYKILNKFPNKFIKRGDAPGALTEPGFYLLDDDTIGYSIHDGESVRTRQTHAENIVGLISDYHAFQARIYANNERC